MPIRARPKATPIVASVAGVLGNRYGLSPVMIGRQAALARLRRLADQAEFHVALVSGEAGIGKTRLIRELASSAGVRLVAGQADQLALARPLALVTDLLTASVASVSSVSSVVDAVDAVAALTASGPAIVVFEDLHWADSDSVEVFERLARLRPAGMLLVGTFRTEDLSRRMPAGGMLARLERRHEVERIRLDRLDRAEVAAFLALILGGPVASTVADAMYERTGGNPFFLEELMTCCTDRSAEDLVHQPLPWSLEDLVRQQLDILTPSQRCLAETAAILGVSEFDVLAAVAGLEEEALVRELRVLVDSGLLLEPREDVFVFRHALVRDAVEKHLLGRERRRLHLAALEVMTTRPQPSWTDLARHAAGAGRFDEMVAHVRSGAVHELRHHGSSHVALRYATEALAEEPDDPELLEVSTEAAWLLGFNDEALATARRLLDLGRRSGALGVEATGLRWVTRLLHDLGAPEAAAVHSKELEALLERPLARLDRLRTMAAVAQSAMLRYEHRAAVDWADRCAAEIDPVNDAPEAIDVLAQVNVERGSAMWAFSPETGLEDAVAFAEERGLWVLVTRGLNNLFDTTMVHTAAGQAAFTRFLAAAERAGFTAMTSVVAAVREVDLAFGLGNVRDVEAALARTREWLPAHRHTEGDRVAILELQLAVEDGQSPENLAQHDALLGPSCLGSVEHGSLYVAIRLAGLRGDAEAVRSMLAAIADSSAFSFDVGWSTDAIFVAAGLGIERAALQRAFARAIERRSRIAELIDLAAVEHADPAGFATGLGAVLADPTVVEPMARPMLGELWVRLGRAQLRSGDPAGAAASATRASALLAHWRGRRCDALEELLRSLEPAVREQRLHGTALTRREQEVAELVAEGLTNGQLADRLFISRKTASVHVSNILMKLGMSNRAEIAAWFVRRQHESADLSA